MVESLTMSLSLSTVSPSAEEYRLSQAYWTLLPFKPYTTGLEKVVAAQTFLVHLLSRSEGVGAPWKLARWLYRSRYSRLYPETGLLLLNSRFTCYEDEEEAKATVRASMNAREIISVAEKVAQLINDPSISKAVRQMWLGDYIEEVARWAMEGPGSVVLFLTECLNFDSIPIVEEVEGPPVMKVEFDNDAWTQS